MLCECNGGFSCHLTIPYNIWQAADLARNKYEETTEEKESVFIAHEDCAYSPAEKEKVLLKVSPYVIYLSSEQS